MEGKSAAAPREERSSDCLHCVVMTAIEAWAQQQNEVRHGAVVIDVVEVTSKLAECIVETIQSLGSRTDRRRAMRFAHESLDAALKASQTGRLQAVDIPSEH